MKVKPFICACENRFIDGTGTLHKGNLPTDYSQVQCNRRTVQTPFLRVNFGNFTLTAAVYDDTSGALIANRTVHDPYKVMCSLYDGNPGFVDGSFYLYWSECMYACHDNKYTPDQWGGQCYTSPKALAINKN